ncbi:hypothetical protein LIER_06832 [Lithospermum erythrorhizon]|uniref:Uncharacterized protein n=1 Tax=Lithospermum erythrorhizon TaxID=34254 RepID=A0AAV3P6P1_LITER
MWDAKGQWRKRWSAVSNASRQKEHLVSMQIFVLFEIWPFVGSLLRRIFQRKILIFCGTDCFQSLSQDFANNVCWKKPSKNGSVPVQASLLEISSF